MVRKRSGALLKRELDNLSFLQTHPEVQKNFSNAGCIEFVERLQVGCHQATAEAFAKNFDGVGAGIHSGLLAGAEPDSHQFNVTICLKGDQMEENSEQYHLNSETRPGMHERVRS
jgi:hypothetical protein